jgi:predicted Zn-dependent protease
MTHGKLTDYLIRSRRRLACLLLAAAMSGSAISFVEPVRAQQERVVLTNETAGVYRKIPEIENQLYGHAYPNQPLSKRISRIERTLFGAPQRGPLAQRIPRIEFRINEHNSRVSLAEQEPIIEYLEEKLFQRTFPEKQLPERIRQLETQVFGHAYDSYPLSIRIKKLTYAMPIMSKEIRLTKGDMVIASTSRTSQQQRGMTAKGESTREVVELDALGSPPRKLPNGETLSRGDYFQAIHRNTNGTMLRWAELPIKVHIRQADALESSITGQAIRAWQSAFSVTETNSPLQADVIVSWDRADWEQNSKGIATRPAIQVGDSRNIRTVILINMSPMKGQPSGHQLRAVSHQLGHAFGIWGHSDAPGDIMYPAFHQEMNDYPSRWRWRSATAMSRLQPTGRAEGYQPSQRDINTLLRIYDQPAADLSTLNPY